MFTWASKYLFAVSGASLLGAVLYGLISGGGLIGVVSLGYKGGVGDHVGYTILLAIGVVALFLAVLNLIIRDGDAAVASEVAGVDGVLAVSTPRRPSFWAPLAGFGLACIAVGLAVSQAFVILGIAILAVVGLEWTVLAWSERATGDDDVNTVIRTRTIGPLEVPMLATLGIAVVVIGISRVLLAVSAAAATAVAAIVALAVFGSAIAIAKSRAPRSVVAGVVALGAVSVLGGGIVGAVVGEREIVHHSEEGESHSEDESDGESHGEDGEDGESSGEGEGEGE